MVLKYNKILTIAQSCNPTVLRFACVRFFMQCLKNVNISHIYLLCCNILQQNTPIIQKYLMELIYQMLSLMMIPISFFDYSKLQTFKYILNLTYYKMNIHNNFLNIIYEPNVNIRNK